MRLLVEVIMRCEYVVATLLMFPCLSTSKTTLLLMTADRRDIRQLHSAPVHLDEIHVLFVQDEGCGFFGKMCLSRGAAVVDCVLGTTVFVVKDF